METPAEYKVPGRDNAVALPVEDLKPVEVGAGIILMHPLELVRQMQPFAENARNMSEQADRAVIDTDEAWQKGTEFMSTITQQWNTIEDLRNTAKGPVNDLASFIQSQCTPSQGLLMAAMRKVEALMLAYRRKVLADKEAADKIVRERQEAEALKLADQEEKKGNTGVAAAILDAATTAAPARAPAPIGGVRTNSLGRSTNLATRWVGSAAEPMTILAGIIAGKIPISVIEFKQIELNNVAKSVGVEGTFMGIKVEKAEKLQQR